MKNAKKLIAGTLAMSMIAMASVGCTAKKETGNDTYTYNTTIPGATVHTLNCLEWEYEDEHTVMALTQRGLYDIVYSDTEKYEYINEMAAAAPVDVTDKYAGNETYNVPDDAAEGYAFQIKLREDAKWDDGTAINADTYIYSMKQALDSDMQNYRAATYYQGTYALANAYSYYYDGDVDFDSVGIVKDNDYTITIIFERPITEEYTFYLGFTNNWIVKEDIYEANKQDTGSITKTTYGTSVDSYASYGPYKLTEWQDGKVIKLTRNEEWYGWNDKAFEGQYQTTDFVFNIIDEHATAVQLFLQGKLDDVALDVTDLETYGTSDYIIYSPTSRTYKLSFNGNRDELSLRSKDGINKMLLLYKDFRKAVSLSIDRAELCQQAYPSDSAAYGLFNDLYIYNVETQEIYRESDEAKQALCDVYDTDDYESLSDYNVDEAKELFEKAYQEALEAGDIDETDKVVLQLNVTEINDTNTKACNFFNDAVQSAVKGTSLEGRISIELLKVEDDYAAMLNGTADIIFSSWMGNESNPYALMQYYCEEEYYCDAEHGFDNTQTATFSVDGKEYTMSFYDWYKELLAGTWATADTNIRLEVLAGMEAALLKEYNCVPLRSVSKPFLLSQKVEYITYEFNGAYTEKYGGFRFMTYKYTDAEWEEYCAEQNNQLKY